MEVKDLATGMLISECSSRSGGSYNTIRKILFINEQGCVTKIVKSQLGHHDGVQTYFYDHDLKNAVRYWEPCNEQTSYFIFLNKKKPQAWDQGSCHYFTTREAAEAERVYFKKLGDDVTTIAETFTDEASRAG